MAASTVTVTGLDDLEAGIRVLPATVQKALHLVALVSAERIKNRAGDILRSKTHGSGATASAIKTISDPQHKQVIVSSVAPRGKPEKLPVYLEYGTVDMTARSYMRPAGDAEDPIYKRNMIAAAEQAVTKALT